MEVPGDPAGDDAREQRRWRDDGQHEADPGALARAALAELVLLDLALVVDDGTDRIELDVDGSSSQVLSTSTAASAAASSERSRDHLLVRHRVPPSSSVEGPVWASEGQPSMPNGTSGCQSDGATEATGSNGVDHSRRPSDGAKPSAT